MIGQRIGNYQVVRLLQEGSAGVLYEAMHRRSKQHVAIRVLRSDLSRDESAGVRLFNDVAALGGVQHRSVVTVIEAGMLPDGAAYVAIELVEGHSLTARLAGEGGEMDGAIALSVAWQLAGVLHAGHQRGVLHGDLRPDAVLLVPEPAAPAGVRVKLPDLGLAWLEGSPTRGAVRRLPAATPTPIFLAPEQLEEPGETTSQSDVYALGGVLYQLMAGRPPFGERGTADAGTAPLLPLREVDSSIPAELAALVQQMLDANPIQRPEMEQVAITLERLVVAEGLVPGRAPSASSARAKPRRRRQVAVFAACALLLAAGAVTARGLRVGWRPGWAPGWALRAGAASAAPSTKAPEGPVAVAVPLPAKSADPPAAPIEKDLAGQQGEIVAAGPAALPLVPPSAPPPADAEAPQRPVPVALEKAPIPPLRLDIGHSTKKKAGRGPSRPPRAPLPPADPEASAPAPEPT